MLLPAVALAAGDPMPDIRDAALHALVAFAQKAGSLGALDKARPPHTHGEAVPRAGSSCCTRTAHELRARVAGAAHWQDGRHAQEAAGGAVGGGACGRRGACCHGALLVHQATRPGGGSLAGTMGSAALILPSVFERNDQALDPGKSSERGTTTMSLNYYAKQYDRARTTPARGRAASVARRRRCCRKTPMGRRQCAGRLRRRSPHGKPPASRHRRSWQTTMTLPCRRALLRVVLRVRRTSHELCS